VSSSIIVFEQGQVDFTDGDTGQATDSAVVTLTMEHGRAPVVVASFLEPATAPDDASVSVFVEAISKTSFTLRTSNATHGIVEYRAMSSGPDIGA